MNSLYSLLATIFLIAATSLSRASGGIPFGAATPRHAAIVQLLPVATLSVGTFGYSAAGESAMIARLLTLRASTSDRAAGSEQGTISPPPATRSCNPGAAPFDGTHGAAAGSTLRSCSMPAIARCQMPPCPVPEALNLPGFA